MICEKCGAKLKDNSKFCGACGTRVESPEGLTAKDAINIIHLAPMPLGLTNCSISITGVSAVGPDTNGSRQMQCRY